MGEGPPRALVVLLLLTAVILSAAVLGSTTEPERSPSRDANRPRGEVFLCAVRGAGTPITTPDFVGKDTVAAVRLACDYGLRVSWDWGNEPRRLTGLSIQSQEPKAGTPFVTGSTVELSFH